MIALIVLLAALLLFIGYVWLLVFTRKFIKRRTGSTVFSWVGVIVIIVLTFGDTVFNRWYHQDVLCKREDVGVRIFEKVPLPSAYWDIQNKLPKLPGSMSINAPFLDRYAEVEKYDRGGLWPITSYVRYEASIVDVKTNRVLSSFVNYEPTGGLWWSFPLSFFGETSAIGWLLSRERPASCFDHPIPIRGAAFDGAFTLADPKEIK